MGIGWTYTSALTEQAGGDPKKIQFVELPFPQMPDALLNNQVDAAQLSDPADVDDDVRRGDAYLHHVDQALAAGENARVLVAREETHGLVDRVGARVLDLPQQHRR